MTVTIYGIKTCDTVKKARTWLEGRGVKHTFVDYRAEGLDPKNLARWKTAVGWEKLLNRAGTTWRKLDEVQQQLAVDEAGALALMATQPSLIKRPVVAWPDGSVTVGFPDLQTKAGAR